MRQLPRYLCSVRNDYFSNSNTVPIAYKIERRQKGNHVNARRGRLDCFYVLKLIFKKLIFLLCQVIFLKYFQTSQKDEQESGHTTGIKHVLWGHGNRSSLSYHILIGANLKIRATMIMFRAKRFAIMLKIYHFLCLLCRHWWRMCRTAGELFFKL